MCVSVLINAFIMHKHVSFSLNVIVVTVCFGKANSKDIYYELWIFLVFFLLLN